MGEDEEEEIDDDDDEEEEELNQQPTPGGLPIKVSIRTNLNVPLIDQTLDFTASQKRDVASIKLSISRQMRGRPPVSSQTLMLGSRVLKDDEIIYDLLDEWEDESEDDDEDDDDETDGNQDPDKMVENQLAKEEEETVLPLIL